VTESSRICGSAESSKGNTKGAPGHMAGGAFRVSAYFPYCQPLPVPRYSETGIGWTPSRILAR
jgi:hypothetical protein